MHETGHPHTHEHHDHPGFFHQRDAPVDRAARLWRRRSSRALENHSRLGRWRRDDDPLSYGVGALLLLAVSLVACVVPVLRATSVDPVAAIRME